MTSTSTKWALMPLLVIMLAANGCDGGNPKITDVNYFEGSNGLTMEFMDNTPPEKVYPDMQYPITMTLRNEGAFSLLPSRNNEDLYARMTLIYDPFFFQEPVTTAGFWDEREELYLEGKSIYWPGGETRVFTVGSLQARTVGENRIGADTDIVVSMCFPYETKLTTQVCVDNDPFENTDPAQPCHTEDLVLRDQGAPVAIKSVAVQTMPIGTQQQQVLVRQGVTDENGALIGFEEVTSNEVVTVLRPTFRMLIQNVGQGQVIRGRERGEQKLCLREPGDETPSNSVIVTAYLGNKELSCRPSPAIMQDDEAEVVCMIKPEDDMVVTRNYYDILQVYVDYVYQIREKITVQIDDSMKAYTAPEYTSFKCMDFDNDYESCKSISETSPLDCYYCDSLRQCFNANDCRAAPCPDGEVADEYSHKCGRPCPEPTARATANLEIDLLTLTCMENRYVSGRDRDRCGCASLAYAFVQDHTLCDDIETYTGEVVGKVEGGTMKAFVNIDESYQNGDQWYLCVISRSADGGISKPSYTSIRYLVDNPLVQVVTDNNI